MGNDRGRCRAVWAIALHAIQFQTPIVLKYKHVLSGRYRRARSVGGHLIYINVKPSLVGEAGGGLVGIVIERVPEPVMAPSFCDGL